MEDDYNPSGTITVINRYGLGARGIDRIERYASSTTTYGYPLYDGHGNMRAVLAKSGSSYTTGNWRTYDVWGSLRSGGSSSDPEQAYCANLGHVDDAETDLIYMRARYMEPGTGRFITQDPARDGWNWYTYCLNDPVNFADESGNSAHLLVLGFLNALGGAVGFALGAGIAAYVLQLLDPKYKPTGVVEICVGIFISVAQGIATTLASDTKAAGLGRMSITQLAKAISKSLNSLSGAVKWIAFSGAAKVGLIFGVYTALMSYFLSDAWADNVEGWFD